MTLSIVIPSFRRVDLLDRCLHSVRLHAPSETQIIVVDDGSTNAIVSQCATTHTNVCVIRHERSLGFACAANAGVARATGDIVELLNDDTIVTANWADSAIKHFRDPSIVAVAPLVLMNRDSQTGPIRIDSAGDDYDCGGFAFKRGHGQILTDAFRTGGPVWGVSASAGFYRRSSFVMAGGFPTDFGAYFEDVDLSHRLNRLGRIVYEPDSVVWHSVSSSYGRQPSRKTLIYQSTNEERVYWRNRQSIATIPRHLAVLFAKSIRRLCEGQFEPWINGRIRAILPMIRSQSAL